jgi:hypothetical protein
LSFQKFFKVKLDRIADEARTEAAWEIPAPQISHTHLLLLSLVTNWEASCYSSLFCYVAW